MKGKRKTIYVKHRLAIISRNIKNHQYRPSIDITSLAKAFTLSAFRMSFSLFVSVRNTYKIGCMRRENVATPLSLTTCSFIFTFRFSRFSPARLQGTLSVCHCCKRNGCCSTRNTRERARQELAKIQAEILSYIRYREEGRTE